jgi:hypothetical protein
LGTCKDFIHGRNSLSGRTNGHGSVAHDGVELGEAFSELSSGSQSCGLVELGCQLAPSERYYQGKVRKHKKLTLWARQMVVQARRWLPKRLLAVVADSSFAVMDLLWQLRQLKNPICMITRLPLDAAWYEPAPALPAKRGRPPKTNILVGSD